MLMTTTSSRNAMPGAAGNIRLAGEHFAAAML
jgi:hypothetical protein